MSEPLRVGDTVAIRGDRRWNHGRNCCAYTPDQLVDGKYLKHAHTGAVWTGKVTKLFEDRVCIGSGGSWSADLVVKYPPLQENT